MLFGENFDPRSFTAMSEEQYAERWHNSAMVFAQYSHYFWMAEQVGSLQSVLEVGCGSGEATYELTKKVSNIVVVEVSPVLASAARDLLVDKGIDVNLVDSPFIEPLNFKEVQVTILVCDFFDSRIEYLLAGSCFGAVICWMIGAYPDLISKNIDKSIDQFSGEEMAEYREKIHRRCYEIGVNILDSDGVVNIVDRMGVSSWNDKNELRKQICETHSDLANRNYNISYADCMLRKIDMSLINSADIGYISSRSDFVTVISSVTARIENSM